VLGEHEAVGQVGHCREDVPGRCGWWLILFHEVSNSFNQHVALVEKKLPEYMVRIPVCGQVPLTLMEMDRRSLPSPGSRPVRIGFCSPRTEIERTIFHLAAVLHLEKVGIYDNF
jgi:hypothetical protein